MKVKFKIYLGFLLFFSTVALADVNGRVTFYFGPGSSVKTVELMVPGDIVGNNQPIISIDTPLFYRTFYAKDHGSSIKADVELVVYSDLICTTAKCGGLSIPASEIIFDIHKSDNNPRTTYSPQRFDLTNTALKYVAQGSGQNIHSESFFKLDYKNQTIYPAGKYKLRMNLKFTPTQ